VPATPAIPPAIAAISAVIIAILANAEYGSPLPWLVIASITFVPIFLRDIAISIADNPISIVCIALRALEFAENILDVVPATLANPPI